MPKGVYRRPSPSARFWGMVNKEGPYCTFLESNCWVWKGGVIRGGYGHFWVAHKTVKAHRDSYELSGGLVPPDKIVMHKCDTPACVNPCHLAIGTVQDNVADRVRKKRSAFGDRNGKRTRADLIKKGENAPNTVLTWEIVRQLRAAYRKRSAKFGVYGLAEQFGISRAVIWRVVAGKIWRE